MRLKKRNRFISFWAAIILIFSIMTPAAGPITVQAADENDDHDSDEVEKQDAKDDSFELSLMHMNDTHAHVEPLPQMLTAIKEFRAEHEDAMLFHGGDVFSGTLYFNEFQGKAALDLLNMMDIDAMAFGNHEFDLGDQENGHASLSEFVSEANFPMLGSNIDFSGDSFMSGLVSDDSPVSIEGDLDGDIYNSIIKEVDGEEIGIFGLTTEDTKDIGSPEDVTFSDFKESAEQAIDELENAGVNKIIAVNHIGYDSDPSVGNDLRLASEVDGIDVIVGGHSHTALQEPVLVEEDENGDTKDPTVIVQAGEYSEHLGTLDVIFDEEGIIEEYSGKLLDVDDYAADDEAEEVLSKYKEEVDETKNEEIGAEAEKDIPNPRKDDTGNDSVRANETELGNLVTDAMLAKAQEKFPETAIAFQNGGGIRAPIDAGPITVGDVINVLPFGNDPVISEVTGSEIEEILEHSVRDVPEETGFLQVSGMKFTFDSTKEPGERVVDIFVEKDDALTPVESDETYVVTTNNFIGQGGSDYETFAKAYDEGRVKDIGEVDWEQFRDYMADEEYLDGEVNPEREGRIVDLEGEDVPDDPEEPGDEEDEKDGDEGENENEEANFELSLMHMNDTHAHTEAFTQMITGIKEFRANNEHAMLFHGGDVFSGTLYFNEFKGQADLAMLNLMDIDAMVFGNHEFDLGDKEEGHESLSEFVKGANFPMLGSNIDFTDDPFMSDLVVEDAPVHMGDVSMQADDDRNVYNSIIKEVDGEEIGIFGLTTEDTIDIASPVDVTFNDFKESAETAIAELEEEGVNKIIAVNHIGYDSDPSVGNDLRLASEVDGIDIIVGGHSHTVLDEPFLVDEDDNGEAKDPTVIVQAGEYAEHLGTLDVTFDEEGVVDSFSGELLDVDEYEADEEAEEVLSEYKETVDEVMNEEIGAEAMKDLTNPRQDEPGDDSVRATETELGNVITDAMLAKAQEKFPETAISFQNGGGIREAIDEGPITVGEVISVLPFGNDPVMVELSGSEIKDILEHSVRQAPAESGGFLHVSGMMFYYDSTKDVGERVVEMYVEQEGELVPIESNETYPTTTNGFTGQGGDGFETFAEAYDDGRVKDIGEIDWEQFRDYMVQEEYLDGVVDPEIEGRIVDLEGEDPPSNPEEPEEPENGDDNGDGDDPETHPDNGNGTDGHDGHDKDDQYLPKTATNIYNFLLIGALLIISGVIVYIYQRKRGVKSH